VFDDPERDAWQKPEAVIDLFALGPASKVADVGAGTGYFAVRIARRVPNGRVYAVDVEPDMVRYLGERAARESLAQITPVLASSDDAKIPEPVDVVLIVDTLHHIDNRPAYLAKLRDALKDGGRLFVVDFTLDSAMGPPKQHRLAPEAVVKDAEQAGLHAFPVALELPNQYVLGFKR
jgi:ubiquinone/menaquinone biosynthesis C-methylase UbiE